MDSDVTIIPLSRLMLLVIPVVIVSVFYYRWMMNYREILYASLRMVIQLLLMGYALNYLFLMDHAVTTMLVFAVMLAVSGWIALRSLKHKSMQAYGQIMASIAVGGLTSLIFITQFVIDIGLDEWFTVKYMIPLGGMAFSNAMNTVCLAAERFESEIAHDNDYIRARGAALQASMIPVVNMLLAVGLVSFPGVMTGQILSGISPLIAVRYQMIILVLVLGAAGIATIFYLALLRPKTGEEEEAAS